MHICVDITGGTRKFWLIPDAGTLAINGLSGKVGAYPKDTDMKRLANRLGIESFVSR